MVIDTQRYKKFTEHFNKKQIKALAKNRDFDIFVNTTNNFQDILVRQDDQFDSLRHIANKKQRYVMRVWIWPGGKILGYTIDKNSGKDPHSGNQVWDRVKSVGEV